MYVMSSVKYRRLCLYTVLLIFYYSTMYYVFFLPSFLCHLGVTYKRICHIKKNVVAK